MVRMLVVVQTRAMDLCEVLCYELGHIPWAIAGVDGTLVKTAKSSLLEVLKKELPSAEDIPHDTAWVIDGMAVLKTLHLCLIHLLI